MKNTIHNLMKLFNENRLIAMIALGTAAALVLVRPQAEKKGVEGW